MQGADLLADPASDAHTGNAALLRSYCNRGWGLAQGGLMIDLALCGQHQISAVQRVVYADEIEYQLSAGSKLG